MPSVEWSEWAAATIAHQPMTLIDCAMSQAGRARRPRAYRHTYIRIHTHTYIHTVAPRVNVWTGPVVVLLAKNLDCERNFCWRKLSSPFPTRLLLGVFSNRHRTELCGTPLDGCREACNTPDTHSHCDRQTSCDRKAQRNYIVRRSTYRSPRLCAHANSS